MSDIRPSGDPDPALVQAARQLVEKLGASLLAGRSPAILRIIEEEMAAFGAARRAKSEAWVDEINRTLQSKIADLNRANAQIAGLLDAWGESWDCSSDPGHRIMHDAVAAAEQPNE